MQATAAVRVQLPARSACRTARAQRASVSCMGSPQRQQQQAQQEQAQQEQVQQAATAALLSLGSAAALASPALAEEAEVSAAAAKAASSGASLFGVTPAGWLLATSPIIFYALFNIYRSQVDPRAKFGDAVFAFAALILLANIVSIVAFKVRLF